MRRRSRQVTNPLKRNVVRRKSVITVADLDTHIVIVELSQNLRSGFGRWCDNLNGTDLSHQTRHPIAWCAPTCIGPILDCLRAKSDFGYGVAEGE